MVGFGFQRLQPPVSVLYADPHDGSRARIEEALEDATPAFAVDTVTSAGEIRNRLLREPVEYACVITEYRFETTTALELINELRSEDDVVPIILYTDEGDERLACDAVAAGAAGYVPKSHPDDLDRLLEQLRAALDEERTRQWTVEAMHEIALMFESCSSIDETFTVAVEAIDQLLGGRASAMFVVDGSPATTRVSDTLRPVAVAGASADRAYLDSPASTGIAQQAARSGNSIAIDPTTYAAPVAHGDGSPIRSVLSVPVDDIGVLQTVSTASDAFDEEAVKHAELLGAHVASTVSRIRSERALRNERDRFASLFESVPDAVALCVPDDGENRVLNVNPGFEDAFGYDRSTIVGASLDDYVIPEDGEPIGIYDRVGLDGVVTTDVERVTVDGRRHFLFRGFATEVCDEIHEYAIYTDITDKKRRERELKRYRTLVETVGDSMYVLSTEGEIEMINDAMAEALGDDRESIVGSPATAYMPDADVERGAELIRALHRDADRRWGTFEMTIEPADGSEPYLAEDNVALLVDDGELVGSVGVVRDISDRKERERRIRRLHDGTRRLMAAEAIDEVARVATEFARDALDLPLNSIHLYDEAAGGLAPVAVTDDLDALLGDVPTIEPDGGLAWDAYEAGLPIAHGDVRHADNVRNPDTPIRSEAHIPLGEEGIFIVSSTEPNDFDEEALTLAKILAANVEAALQRARREGELAARSRELERQNDRLEQFAGTVSHDLRNPLTLANGHLEAVREAVGDEGIEHVTEMEWALDRMNELIEDVLLLARSGQQLTDTDEVDLGAVVDQAHRTVDPGLEVVSDSLPTVDADENRLLVCFENILRNAREHVGDDVTVTVRETDDGFAIEDDGPGIPADRRDDVFRSGYSTVADGTGFGLAIVSEVVEAHGWSITVGESEDGGVRFDVSIEGERSDNETIC